MWTHTEQSAKKRHVSIREGIQWSTMDSSYVAMNRAEVFSPGKLRFLSNQSERKSDI